MCYWTVGFNLLWNFKSTMNFIAWMPFFSLVLIWFVYLRGFCWITFIFNDFYQYENLPRTTDRMNFNFLYSDRLIIIFFYIYRQKESSTTHDYLRFNRGNKASLHDIKKKFTTWEEMATFVQKSTAQRKTESRIFNFEAKIANTYALFYKPKLGN